MSLGEDTINVKIAVHTVNVEKVCIENQSGNRANGKKKNIHFCTKNKKMNVQKKQKSYDTLRYTGAPQEL
jgi:hypothetical protein